MFQILLPNEEKDDRMPHLPFIDNPKNLYGAIGHVNERKHGHMNPDYMVNILFFVIGFQLLVPIRSHNMCIELTNSCSQSIETFKITSSSENTMMDAERTTSNQLRHFKDNNVRMIRAIPCARSMFSSEEYLHIGIWDHNTFLKCFHNVQYYRTYTFFQACYVISTENPNYGWFVWIGRNLNFESRKKCAKMAEIKLRLDKYSHYGTPVSIC